MADAALDYIQNLIKSGKKPIEIKKELSEKGWESEVIDLYLSKISSDKIVGAKSSNKILILVFTFLIFTVISIGIYYYLNLPKLKTTLNTPSYEASPSAQIITDTEPLRQLKSGYALLFAPPEYGYEATISAQIENCTQTTFIQARSIPEMRYDLQTITNSASCPKTTIPNNFLETFRFKTEALSRQNSQEKFEKIPQLDFSKLPEISDSKIKEYISSPELHKIIGTENTNEGMIIKTRLETDTITGNYYFTVRPINFRIAKVNFSASLNSNSTTSNINGELTFMNRARLTTPIPSLIK